VEQGYTAVKLGWGPLGRDPLLDVALVKAAREAAGPDCDLMIDIGLMYDAATAMRMVRLFEPFNLFWLEEPLPPDDLAGYARLADAVETRIAAGEEESTIYGFRELVERGHVDVIQPDLARCGGFTEARKIGYLAAEQNLLCVPHAFSTGILVSASLHFAATLRRGNLAEFSVQDSPFVRDLLRTPFRLESDGTVKVPTGAGLGIEIDEDVLEKYRYRG
jgi:L-alanine-DL-glutamate epimerase-like enolase superfamily enzyme